MGRGAITGTGLGLGSSIGSLGGRGILALSSATAAAAVDERTLHKIQGRCAGCGLLLGFVGGNGRHVYMYERDQTEYMFVHCTFTQYLISYSKIK